MDAPTAAPAYVEPAAPALDASLSLPAWGATASIGHVGGSPLDFLPKHDPMLAMGLSIAVDGAGQFYDGETAKGWWMLGSWLLYPLAWGLDSALGTGYFRTGALVVELGIKGYSAWDAYETAQAYQQAHRGAR